MAYHKLKQSKPEYDPDYVQKKIDLIVKGLPIDISEEELRTVEEMLRGARSFYIDLLIALESNRAQGEDVDVHYTHEAINIAGTEIALRKIDDFRKVHHHKIKAEQ